MWTQFEETLEPKRRQRCSMQKDRYGTDWA